ncbi:MAG: tetratricopeptide repeat protein [Alphaproteobacteria bacterium]|nr:tetratricopeptide repeat protein [Alphaproteobacteria bacterium]
MTAVDLGEALAHHRAGRLHQAEPIYRARLKQAPDDADAAHFLGVLLAQTGRAAEAERHLARASGRDPSNAELWFNYGAVLNLLGRRQGAVTAFRRVLDLAPNHVGAANNLGGCLAALGRHDEAVPAFERAIVLASDFAPAHGNLGLSLSALGRHEAALAAYARAVALAPNDAESWNGYGMAAMAAKRFEAAESHFRRAIELAQGHAPAWANLAAVLARQGRSGEALAAARRAVAVQPGYAHGWNNLGLALGDAGDDAGAIEAHEHALKLDPLPHYRLNHAVALKEAGFLDEAIARLRIAIGRDGEFGPAHFNLALALLLKGDYAGGFAKYESRRTAQAARPGLPPIAAREWLGEDLAGRRILLVAEQGLGDVVQMLRYVPILAARGALVTVEVQPVLASLAATVAGVEAAIAQGQPLPETDYWLPMMSLPYRLGTTLESVPWSGPYVRAEGPAATILPPGKPRIGFAWRGAAGHVNDRRRSLSLDWFGPLIESRGAWVSLQFGDGKDELARSKLAARVTDPTGSLADFAATARVMAELDLVVTVDTATAHLAGALGRPCWVLLRAMPDWRWGLEGERTPWYPDLRLFRQSKPGDWNDVREAVLAALTNWKA